MKRSALIRELIRHGCVLHRHGSRHDIFLNPSTGQKQPGPRHSEIDDTLARHIRKNLGLPPRFLPGSCFRHRKSRLCLTSSLSKTRALVVRGRTRFVWSSAPPRLATLLRPLGPANTNPGPESGVQPGKEKELMPTWKRRLYPTPGRSKLCANRVRENGRLPSRRR